MMKRILLSLVMVLSTVAFSACMQQKAEDTITRYCLDLKLTRITRVSDRW